MIGGLIQGLASAAMGRWLAIEYAAVLLALTCLGAWLIYLGWRGMRRRE